MRKSSVVSARSGMRLASMIGEVFGDRFFHDVLHLPPLLAGIALELAIGRRGILALMKMRSTSSLAGTLAVAFGLLENLSGLFGLGDPTI